MAEEQKLKKEETIETEAEQTNSEEQKVEYKRSDYEYKSWSAGVAVPDGWERCAGYADVIRRLKPVAPETEDKPVNATIKNTSCEKKAKDNIFAEPWNKPHGGCCC